MNKQHTDSCWFDHDPSSITVCDTEGTIVAMNKASRSNFKKYGGGDLIGKSLFACHPESANEQIREMLKEQISHTYIIEVKGKKRLVHQAPWYDNARFAGLIETIMEFSGDIEVLKRD